MTATTITDALKSYLAEYTSLKKDAPIWVNYLGSIPPQYTIVPLGGARAIEKYLNGKGTFEFPFAFQSVESTADELERLETIGFYEEFAAWLDSQTEENLLPELPSGKQAETIEALGWAYLFEQGESETGIYQIQCRLIYETI